MKLQRLLSSALCTALVAIAFSDIAAAQEPAVETSFPAAHPDVITQHTGTFHGQEVAYRALVETTDVQNADGKFAARIVSIGYVADGVADQNERPVLFVFNGGPITASIWLHMGALGPKRVAFPDDLEADPSTYKLIDNAYSPLDVADIVMFDPASTGFSRVLPGTEREEYFSVTADGQQLAAFITSWLEKHDRPNSPVYLLGESYGAHRAAETAAQLSELDPSSPPAGVILFGQALNIIEFSQRTQNIISYVVSLPTLAATAYHHDQARTRGRDFSSFVADAWAFAQDDYLEALFEGQGISERKKARIARKLEEYTGIPASYYIDSGLRIKKEEYRTELFREQGKVLGRSDSRYIGDMPETGWAPDPSSITRPGFTTYFHQHLEENLGIDWDDEYIEVADVGGIAGWGWGGATPFSDWPYSERISVAFNSNPAFRLFIGNGWHDTMTTYGAAEYVMDQSDWPLERVQTGYYQGGHMAYTVEASAKAFGTDLRDFIAAGSTDD